jgi:hypothetical protein
MKVGFYHRLTRLGWYRMANIQQLKALCTDDSS